MTDAFPMLRTQRLTLRAFTPADEAAFQQFAVQEDFWKYLPGPALDAELVTRFIAARVAEAARMLELEPYLERKPRALSGGQRQRVAMGRAIIRNPKAFLFDEPLSNLDAALRVSMRKEIRALHDRLGATSVYVTHDQIEAMTMADHVVVMKDGVIEQQGAPLELYDRPANRFVAGFIGNPRMNFLPGVASEGHARFAGGAVPSPVQGKVQIGIRPEHVAIRDEGAMCRMVELPVTAMESTGSLTYIVLGGEPEVTLVEQGRERVRVGDRLRIAIDPGLVHLYDPATDKRL